VSRAENLRLAFVARRFHFTRIGDCSTMRRGRGRQYGAKPLSATAFTLWMVVAALLVLLVVNLVVR
jgi:hypothetical protein